MVGGDSTARGAILRVLAQNRKGAVEHWCVACMPYLDDNNNFTYPPRAADTVGAVNRACSVGGLHLILTILAADQAGILQHFGKMQLPTRQSAVTLGVTLNFRPEGRMRCAVAGNKRLDLRDEVLVLVLLMVQGRARLVDEAYLREMVGRLNWNFLVRRALLSVLGIVYRALNSPNRPTGKVHSGQDMATELWVAGGMLVFAETISAEFADKAWVYDACKSGKHGGYGVAYRSRLTEEVAVELTTPVRAQACRCSRSNRTGRRRWTDWS